MILLLRKRIAIQSPLINSALVIYLGIKEIESMSHVLYQLCLPFLFQVHKNESHLIKIKWSELTSHFPLHLWSICFQTHSACSNFSRLTLVQFTLPTYCSKHTEASNTLPKTSLIWVAWLSPALHFQGEFLSQAKYISESIHSFVHPAYPFLIFTDAKFVNYNYVKQGGRRICLAQQEMWLPSSCFRSLFE
jgi:hypothetical protein